MNRLIIRRNPIRYLDLSPTLIDLYQRGLPFPNRSVETGRTPRRSRRVLTGPAASRAMHGGTLSAPEGPARKAVTWWIGVMTAAVAAPGFAWRRLFSCREVPGRDRLLGNDGSQAPLPVGRCVELRSAGSSRGGTR